MSDPSGELLPALRAALKADTDFIAAMGGKAKVYDVAPTNAQKPYCILPAGLTIPETAEDCIDAGETDVTLDIWSLPAPPSQAEAIAVANAAMPVLLAAPALTGHTVLAVLPVRVDHLIDPSDGKTAHSIVVVRYSTTPK